MIFFGRAPSQPISPSDTHPPCRVPQVLASLDEYDPAVVAPVSKVQAVARGRHQRQQAEKAKEAQAAVRVQAMLRGHLARDSQQEERRMEWLRFYASEGQYEQALELAVSQTEVDAVRAMREAQATTVEVSERCAWMPCLARYSSTARRHSSNE